MAAPTTSCALLTGLPQVLLVPLLVNVDICLDDRRGYYVGGELDMARGLGTFFGLLIGIGVMLLVALGSWLGTRLRGQNR